MTKRRALSLLIPLMLIGCMINIGPRAAGYEAATRPGGFMGRLDADAPDGRRIVVEGELLAVRDNAFLMLADSTIVRVPFHSLRRAAFAEPTLRFSGPPGPARLERLRLHSRFPQNLDPDVLSRLLGRYSQTEVREAGS